MIRILVLGFIVIGFVSCDKHKIELRFYNQERNVFIEDYFVNDTNWVRSIYHSNNGDTAYAHLANGDMELYSYGYASSYIILDFNDWESDIICFEIGFKSFNGQYNPYDDPFRTSILTFHLGNYFIYRDKANGELFLENSALHIKIERSTNKFIAYANKKNISELFRLKEYSSTDNNYLLTGSATTGYPRMEECETIVDYVILYTIE